MIATLSSPGENLRVVYEILEIQNARILMYKALHAPNCNSLAAYYKYFAARHNLNDRDVIVRLVINDKSANVLFVLRPIQGTFLEDSINDRERPLFLEHSDGLDRMIETLINTEITV